VACQIGSYYIFRFLFFPFIFFLLEFVCLISIILGEPVPNLRIHSAAPGEWWCCRTKTLEWEKFRDWVLPLAALEKFTIRQVRKWVYLRGVEWSGVEWSGVEWSGVEWGGVGWGRKVKGEEPCKGRIKKEWQWLISNTVSQLCRYVW